MKKKSLFGLTLLAINLCNIHHVQGQTLPTSQQIVPANPQQLVPSSSQQLRMVQVSPIDLEITFGVNEDLYEESSAMDLEETESLSPFPFALAIHKEGKKIKVLPIFKEAVEKYLPDNYVPQIQSEIYEPRTVKAERDAIENDENYKNNVLFQTIQLLSYSFAHNTLHEVIDQAINENKSVKIKNNTTVFEINIDFGNLTEKDLIETYLEYHEKSRYVQDPESILGIWINIAEDLEGKLKSSKLPRFLQIGDQVTSQSRTRIPQLLNSIQNLNIEEIDSGETSINGQGRYLIDNGEAESENAGAQSNVFIEEVTEAKGI